MLEPNRGELVRLRHAPLWFGLLKSVFGNAAVVASLPGSEIPDVGGWLLPIMLLEVVRDDICYPPPLFARDQGWRK